MFESQPNYLKGVLWWKCCNQTCPFVCNIKMNLFAAEDRPLQNRHIFGNDLLFPGFGSSLRLLHWHARAWLTAVWQLCATMTSWVRWRVEFNDDLSWLFFDRFIDTRYMKVKRTEITDILKRIWLFSANETKSSESFKKPTQLIAKLNSSLRHITVTQFTINFFVSNDGVVWTVKFGLFEKHT